jgi:TonB family protein
MERARVIAPSVSFAAHAGGAAFLALGLVLLPDRLPAPLRGGALDGLVVSRSFAVSLGGGAGRARARVNVPRATRAVDPFVAPAVVADLAPVPALELGGSGVEGPPDTGGGDGAGVGLCLSNCGPGGPGDGGTADALLPALERRAAPLRARTGGVIREPRKVRHVAPEYPALAVAARVQGRVVLDCVIDEDGRVSSVTVLKPQPLLEAAAVDAVRQWRYVPTLLNGTRVSVLLTVTVDFRLR